MFQIFRNYKEILEISYFYRMQIIPQGSMNICMLSKAIGEIMITKRGED
ncbi:Uncharacterised protein [Porphyromonas macacae]|uniref:Uncharacterized protein n=1 Tax=Porphyromonas macacae TaxID=28115 RepID=A0A379E7Q9_9PORP|nr:Uncharacterised protein [Porphyromonas macacae]